MATNKALIEKRNELKHRLETGEYKTLVDVFLAWFNGVLQKITRRTKPFSIWVVTVYLILVVALIIQGVYFLSGDFAKILENIRELYGAKYSWVGFIVLNLFPSIIIVISVLLNQSIRRIFYLWQKDILDVTDSTTSLHQIESWMEAVCNRRLHLFIAAIAGLVYSLYVFTATSIQLGESVGVVWIIIVTFISVLAMIFLYSFAMIVYLSLILHQYDMKLFAADPASSELLSHLLGEFKLFVNILAFFAALMTLNNIATGASIDIANNILLVLTLWLPISVMFVLSQTSLSSIVRRSKWKTLNEIQAKVEKLQAAKNFETQANMDTINRLLDYHERIKGTRNSSLDLRAILSFVNSLLLPLLAFILGNLDLVLNLFTR